MIIPKDDRIFYTTSHTDKILKGKGGNFRFCLDTEETDYTTSIPARLAILIENASQAYASVQASRLVRDTWETRSLPLNGYKDRMPKTIVLGSSDEGMESLRVKIPVPGFAPIMQTAEGKTHLVDSSSTSGKFQILCDAVAGLGLHDYKTGALLDVVISGAGRMLDEFRADDASKEHTPS